MRFNQRFIALLIRVLLMVGFSFGIVYTSLATDLRITPYMFGGLLLLLCIELIWWLRQQERTWAQFLHSIRFMDFSRTYQYKTNAKELELAYALITDQFLALQTNQEAEFNLLQTLLRHIPIAVICYQEKGDVVFTNKAFHELLKVHEITQFAHLENSLPEVHKAINSVSDIGEVVQLDNGKQLMIRTESFKLKGSPYRLASLTDVGNTLEGKALASYQQLLRVMTHEIMNSTTPILSLIRVVNKKMIHGEEIIPLSPQDQKNTVKSLQAIEERTQGIVQFVDAYKKINQAFSPQLESVDSTEWLLSVRALIKDRKHISLVIHDDFGGQLVIDRALMTQVLLNLIQNAMDAVIAVETPVVDIRLFSEERSIQLIVEDNGPGVAPHLIDEVFVPFYTTKATGSGIGLAISRKIVFAHQGTLRYQRVEQKTHFIISLPWKRLPSLKDRKVSGKVKNEVI